MLPRGFLAHFLVVLGEVALDPVDIGFWQVDASACPLHDVTGGHDAVRDGDEPAVDHVGDEQLVGGEVVLAVAVVPDVRVPVLGVGLILGVSPFPDPFLGCRAVPGPVAVREGEILEADTAIVCPLVGP
jgi:hypothetical protein